MLYDITKGQFYITRDLAGVCHHSASEIFHFLSTTIMRSKAIQVDVVTHLHFLLLLTRDKLHSMLTTAAPTRLPWPSGSKFKIPPLFWDGGIGESRADSFVPRSAGRSSRSSGSSGFSSSTLRPHFGPRKKPWPASLPLRSPPPPARFQGQCETSAPFDNPEAGVLH